MSICKIAIRLIFFAVFAMSTSARSNELDERAAVRAQAESAYRAGDFDSLDRQHSAYSDFLVQRTSSGAFKMTLFFDGITKAQEDESETERLQDITRTLRWVAEHKDSPLAYVLHACALQSYGSYFRGSGFSDTVPPQAWKVYEQYNQKAAKYLLENEPVASKGTSWHAWMLNLVRTSGLSKEVVNRLFEEGVGKNSADFRLYRNVLEYLLPKWHGDVQAIDTFIGYAVPKAPPEYGQELYARLYSGAGEDQFKRRLYIDTLVDWTKMRQGLELWYKNFPTDWNKNILAYHACIAGDKALTEQILKEIGAQPVWEIWQPSAKATFDTCARWAADPEANPIAPRKKPEALQTDAAT
ncbi:hypothetical protein [Nevskia sp.]|uniref:hypothetical protein n=1 Tax=Nevskia sp. TaxID=1929292 RepID=UPI0025D3FF64|nr:hypothetical protein [Nevskia sp.]